MSLEPNAYLSGLTSMFGVIVGWVSGFASFNKARQQNAKLLSAAGAFLICMGCLYLGPSASFLSLLIRGTNIAPRSIAWATYSFAPVGVALGMYVGMSIIRPEYKKLATAIYVIMTPIYWYGLYTTPVDLLLSWDTPPNGLTDINFIGMMRIFTVFLLFSFGLILIGGFMWLSRHTSGVIHKKAVKLTIAFFAFVAFGAIESTINVPTLIGIVRVGMGLTYFTLYWVLAKSNL